MQSKHLQQISSKRSTPWSQRIRAHRLPLYFIKLKSAVFIQTLKFFVQLGEAYEKFCKSWLEGMGLAEHSLEAADFSEYSQPWHNLKGTDFSRCHLQHSNFAGVIGGVSFVRPVVLLVVIVFSLAMTIQVAPYLEEMFQPLAAMISAPQGFGFVFVFAQVSLLYLKISLALLYGGTTLQPHIGQSQPEPNIWSAINQVRTIILTFLPFWLGIGAYSSLLFAFSTFPELQLASIMAIAIAILLAVGATAALIQSIGNAFVFKTSFVKANLESAQLVGASFPGCNFSKSNLRSANLQGGDFRRCNFKQADLRLSDLRGANLKGANLKNARLDGAIGLDNVSQIRLSQEL